MFLKKEISQGRNNSALGSRGFKHYIFDQQFYTNMPESLENMLTHNMQTYDIMILPEVDRIHKKLWILFRLYLLEDPN